MRRTQRARRARRCRSTSMNCWERKSSRTQPTTPIRARLHFHVSDGPKGSLRGERELVRAGPGVPDSICTVDGVPDILPEQQHVRGREREQPSLARRRREDGEEGRSALRRVVRVLLLFLHPLHLHQLFHFQTAVMRELRMLIIIIDIMITPF